MASSYSDKLRLELIATGEQSGTWGNTTDVNLGTLLEQAIAGVATVLMTDADYTLTTNNGAADEARAAVLSVTSSGALTTTRNVICPTKTKLYVVKNGTSGSQSIILKTVAGTGITVPTGRTTLVYCDGTNVVSMFDHIASLGTALAVVNGGTGLAALTTGNVLLGNGTGNVALAAPGTTGNVLTSNGATWAGAPVFASGTRLVFQQTAAPTGWTKDTSATYNDASLRFTIGTVGAGGADGYSTLFGTAKSTASYTLLAADMPAHTHTDSGHTHVDNYNVTSLSGLVLGGALMAGDGGIGKNLVETPATTTTGSGSASLATSGGGGGHSHTLSNFNLKYCDAIIATKD